ncbi:MAG: polyribonucleotide nucleotidyltransferase [Candidatus Kerfeldbacteria bacterium]|nr:polyribonucleotide nucleotidyltransferase [Candidatus Kerfeldbacteria bacterium]
MAQTFEADIGGRVMKIEVGKYAGQTNGSCTVQYGDTVVLATAVIGSTPREGIDYFPLLVDYEERLYAAGKIKGSRFIKREGRPSDEAILTARLVDRSIRPLFADIIRNDVQVVLTVLSVDQENDPDIVSLVAASAALAISPIPWAGPIAGVRVGIINGEWVLNPTYEARVKSDLDLVVSGTGNKVLMIEAGGKEVPEEVVLGAMSFAQKHLKKIMTLIEQAVAGVGQPKFDPTARQSSDEQAAAKVIEQKVDAFLQSHKTADAFAPDQAKRTAATEQLMAELEQALKDDNKVDKDGRAQGLALLQHRLDEEARRLILAEGKRVDGRQLDEIRSLSAEAGVLPRTHGSGLFQRGETQVLSIVTLGAPGDEQVLDTMEESGKKRYMHHYNFPGFSVGEVKPIRGPGRREIGHGALAEKALEPLIPPKEEFPYTIRVVSEVLSSNGSSSQASVCGSTLALMDAGVKIKAPCAGIAMGIVTDEQSGKYIILTDIQGVEDHAGEMDFKVAGTKTGITAIQLDVKNHGLTEPMWKETLAKARAAREKILAVMHEAIAEPRPELSPYAPRVSTLRIDPEKIRDVIGRGGETINKIIDECGGIDVTKIDIEQDGLVMVTSHNAEMAAKAIKWIEDLTREVKVGEIFEGPVTQIVKDRNTGEEIGAIVQILPGQDGMVHISELAQQRINRVSDVVNVGERLKAVVKDVDTERGRISLSVKQINGELPHQPPPYDESARPVGHDRRDRFSRRGRFSHSGRREQGGRGGFSRGPRSFDR